MRCLVANRKTKIELVVAGPLEVGEEEGETVTEQSNKGFGGGKKQCINCWPYIYGGAAFIYKGQPPMNLPSNLAHGRSLEAVPQRWRRAEWSRWRSQLEPCQK